MESGRTIHSFAGVGTLEGGIEQILSRVLENEHAVQRWRTTDLLIIDEVSLLSAFAFDVINRAGQLARQSEEPFGGVQLFVLGDFPVSPCHSRRG